MNYYAVVETLTKLIKTPLVALKWLVDSMTLSTMRRKRVNYLDTVFSGYDGDKTEFFNTRYRSVEVSIESLLQARSIGRVETQQVMPFYFDLLMQLNIIEAVKLDIKKGEMTMPWPVYF